MGGPSSPSVLLSGTVARIGPTIVRVFWTRRQKYSRRCRIPLGERHLREYVSHYVAMDVRQPEVAAAEAVREAFVVEAEQVQDGGVQIVDRADVLGGVHADLVGR